MLELLNRLCQDSDPSVRQHAMLSAAKIICDVMPPYKIGTLPTDEKVKLKRETESVRNFEKTLLANYQTWPMESYVLSQPFLEHLFELHKRIL